MFLEATFVIRRASRGPNLGEAEHIVPNGRSGGFEISIRSLEHCLDGLPADVVVGRVIKSGDVAVSVVRQLVSDYPGNLIAVEEQDHRYYIVHLEPVDASPPNATKWIIVGPESPLFEELRRRHFNATRKPAD